MRSLDPALQTRPVAHSATGLSTSVPPTVQTGHCPLSWTTERSPRNSPSELWQTQLRLSIFSIPVAPPDTLFLSIMTFTPQGPRKGTVSQPETCPRSGDKKRALGSWSLWGQPEISRGSCPSQVQVSGQILSSPCGHPDA